MKTAENLRSVADGPLKDMETGQMEANDNHVERVQGKLLKARRVELEAAKGGLAPNSGRC